MGRRKQSAPIRASDEKRKCMSWNMMDNPTSGLIGTEPPLDLVDNKENIATDSQSTEHNCHPQPDGPYHVSSDLLSMFKLHIENCHGRVIVLSKPDHTPDEWSFELGQFDVNFSTNALFFPLPTDGLPETQRFVLYPSDLPGKSVLCCDRNNILYSYKGDKLVQDCPQFWCVEIHLPANCIEVLKHKLVQVVVKSYEPTSMMIVLQILGTEGLLSVPSYASEAVPRPKQLNHMLKSMMAHFYGLSPPCYDGMTYSRKHDIDGVYTVIKEKHAAETRVNVPDIQHPALMPLLRPYQQEGIKWMLEQERWGVGASGEGDLHVHQLYTEVSTPDGHTLYYNRHVGVLVKERPVCVVAPPGGILGDEMGLGKTVEVLACLLHHPRANVAAPDRLPVLLEEISPPTRARKSRKNKHEMNERKKLVEKGGKVKYLSRQTTGCIEDYDSDDTIIYADSSFTDSNIDPSETSVAKLIDLSESVSECSKDASDLHVNNESETVSQAELGTEPAAISGCMYSAGVGRRDCLARCGKDSPLSKHPADVCDIGNSAEQTESADRKDETNSDGSWRGASTETEASPSLSPDVGVPVSNGERPVVSASAPTQPSPASSIDTCGSTSSSIDVDDVGERSALSASSPTRLTTETDRHSQAAAGTQSPSSSVKSKPMSKVFKNIFTEVPQCHQDNFECICGETKAGGMRGRGRKHMVQCVMCNLWQHAECVNYDLRDQYRGEFKCPHCHVLSVPIESGATLIISPAAIAHQWIDEILKHIASESLNVFMYTGVNKQGFIQPRTLARQDIVITTYETLRKEIDYVDLPHSNSEGGRKLRHPKRFMAIPSPITAVEWWRICLDEAQMVECTTTKTAEMALRLSAVNRWCVTGTPIQKGIEDLYGLLLFLGVDPFWVQQWWRHLICEPFYHGITEPLYHILSSVLWRTVKNDVLDQINIPQQTEHTHWLTFSPVEDHFYRRQYRDCVRLSVERLSKWTDSSTRLSSLDRHTVSQLLYPLLRLRQACCHPQAVRGEFLPIQKTTMTMEELLESLTKKAKLEAEESHRALVAALNGEAGLHIIHDEYLEAIDMYREVLRSVDEHRDQLHTDSLQQLHAMYNLHEILATKPAGLAPTLRDDQLPAQISELKDKYMAKAIAYVTNTLEALTPVQMDVKLQQRELQAGEEWWADVIQWSAAGQQDDVLLQKVIDDLMDNRSPGTNSMVRRCRSAVGLEYVLNNQLTALGSAHTNVLEAMSTLAGKPTTALIGQTVECCLRPVGEVLKTCPFCKSEELFESYETKLFSFVERGIVMDNTETSAHQVNTKRQGTWADSETEVALKAILSYARLYRVGEDLLEYGNAHIKLLDLLKKEYKRLRTHWAGIKEHVATFDELDMSTTRLRLRLTEEPAPDTPQRNILEKYELGQHKLRLASDRIVARAELRKKLGQLLYLINLAKSQTAQNGGENPELCPICQQELGREWSVLQCGHCYCIDCIRLLVERYSVGGRHRTVKCAVCRQTTHQGEISYVMTRQNAPVDSSEDNITVKGSHSTKVEAVVRCLLQIRREDPTHKALVFSTWTDVLSVIARALEENSIEYKCLYLSGKFQQNLSAFKQSDDVTALLLPVHSGANGLNLVEATHVLLVEPILNPAQELQAIGRVHRIGQTKPTHVHRFLIRGTIEQKMHSLLESMNVQTNALNSEENTLTIGDLSSLFTQTIEGQDREGGEQAHEEGQEGVTGLGIGEGNEVECEGDVNAGGIENMDAGSANPDVVDVTTDAQVMADLTNDNPVIEDDTSTDIPVIVDEAATVEIPASTDTSDSIANDGIKSENLPLESNDAEDTKADIISISDSETHSSDDDDDDDDDFWNNDDSDDFGEDYDHDGADDDRADDVVDNDENAVVCMEEQMRGVLRMGDTKASVSSTGDGVNDGEVILEECIDIETDDNVVYLEPENGEIVTNGNTFAANQNCPMERENVEVITCSSDDES